LKKKREEKINGRKTRKKGWLKKKEKVKKKRGMHSILLL
jgi:hypothetical protein